ncbi:MAG: FtsH protease activity modulator HflK [Acidobacteria bacterium]|nr:FtsH protease activity modulator HflK [Acidobacteriota bacterium]
MSAKMIVGVIAVILVIAVARATVYQVQTEEVGVVLRFGEYIKETPPGLRLKIPFVDTVEMVPVTRQLTQQFGFRAAVPGVRSTISAVQFEDESLMLTGDLNVAVLDWIVQYRVANAYDFLFKVRNVEETFRDMNEAVMRGVVGDRTVTEVLTVGRQEIETTVKEKLQALCDQYETGITVDLIVLQDVNPPDPVKPSWDEVNQAQQQRDRMINEAQARYNQVIPRAAGEAQQTILQAEGYALDRVNRSEGDASRFVSIYEEYRRAPDVTRQRLYLETMQRVLPLFGGKLFIDEDARGVLPLLPLDTLRQVLPNGGRAGGPGGDGGSQEDNR